MKSAPLVIPVFLPHEGCPHGCVFCNQRRISGHSGSRITAADVREIILQWLEREENNNRIRPVQVAFYGGSFTGLPLLRQQELLNAVAPFVEQGRLQTIRLSTRPDYIDEARVAFLRAHHVSIVELGVQSLDDRVLALSERGHTAEDVRRAVTLLKIPGLELGIQLMLGLPGQSRRSVMETVTETLALKPDFVRIYPVVVVKNSALAGLYARGRYRPLSLDMAVLLAARMKKYFDRAGIRVVRMGLQAGAGLEEAIIAGPWHPAFGELVQARLMLAQTRKLLAGVPPGQPVQLTIHEKDQSIFRGMKSGNVSRLRQLGRWSDIILRTDSTQARQSVRLITAP